VTVQRSLGHSKATTTLNTYAHLWLTAEDRTRKAAESIMSASLGRHAAELVEVKGDAPDGDSPFVSRTELDYPQIGPGLNASPKSLRLGTTNLKPV